ncbi:MAG: hypothetical protein ACRDZ8_03020 [Acidimicrobiales bacterium]
MVATLERHGVEYLIVGGVAAGAYGAARPTGDFDCVVRQATENLDRVAAVLRELHAFLRVHGMSDDEAAALPVRIDAKMLAGSPLSTWRSDAGDVDVLADIPDRQGRRRRYEDLLASASTVERAGLILRVAGLTEIIASKEWANRPKDREALPELHHIARGEYHQ